jgi:hypothetical protein
MRMRQIVSRFSHATLVTAMLCACATSGRHKDPAVGAEEVRGTEMAFAQTMADRDFNAFVSHLSLPQSRRLWTHASGGSL